MSSEIMYMINKAKAEARVKNIEHLVKSFFNRNGKTMTIALGCLFLVIGWIIISSFREKSEQQRCFSNLNSALTFQEKGDTKKTKEAFKKIYESSSCPGGIKSIASLRYAAIIHAEDKKSEAVAIYQEISKGRNYDPFIRELSALLAVRILVSDYASNNSAEAYDKILSIIKKSESKSEVFRNDLKEQRGILEFIHGNFKDSYQIFDELGKNSDSPESLKLRSHELKKVINQQTGLISPDA